MILATLIVGSVVAYLLVQVLRKRAALKRLKELNEPVTMVTPQPKRRKT
jgi:predicted membrane protein